MPINSLSSKEKGWNRGATDTGPKPGDFPIGSLESRAAARAAVEHAKQHNDELPPEDNDALTLYCGAPLLTSGMSPSYPELEATTAYKRGKEVSERLHGPVTPGLPAPSIGTAALSFKMQFGREPVAGDVLRYQDVFLCDLVRYGKFITAWSRQIPELPCPLKIENGHIFFHEVMEKKTTTGRSTVRLVRRGDLHAIEVTTPDWRRYDESFRGKIKRPDDLKEILAVLDRANVIDREILLVADGTTEIVLDDALDLEAAVPALVAAGWMLPGVQEWNGPDEPTLSHWSCVEAEANGGKHLPTKNAPTIPAVVFQGIIDGKHKCRPATADEIRTGES